jgi:hypothetical protein
MTLQSELRCEKKIFHIQKNGNSPDENEDAYDSSEDNLRFALADGATDSFRSKSWSKLLVDSFIKNPFFNIERVRNPFDLERKKETYINFINWLEPLRQKWKSQIVWKNLRWNAEEKARIVGAFSTFLAIQITSRETRGIGCLSIGDTCVFILHNNHLKKSWPIANSKDFNNTPYLLSSYQKYNVKMEQHIRTFFYDDDCDLIVVATDAFAKWFLYEYEKDNQPWLQFENLDPLGFNELIFSLREAKEIQDDDTTAIFISFD